jgi:hypothetical protein
MNDKVNFSSLNYDDFLYKLDGTKFYNSLPYVFLNFDAVGVWSDRVENHVDGAENKGL